MAHSVLLQPNLPDAASVQLVGSTGIYLAGEGNANLFPPPVYDEEYLSGPFTEGAYRGRSRADDPVGAGRVNIDDPGMTNFWDYVSTWEQTMENVRKYGGTVVYTPEGGPQVEYDIVSSRFTEVPQDGVALGQGHGEWAFEWTYRPYGKLAEVTVVTNANGSLPMLSFDVPELGGSVDALGVLTLTDTATQSRQHAEWGLESRYYDSGDPWPLLIDSDDMNTTDGSTQTTRAGSYDPDATGNNVIQQTLSTTSKGVAYVQSTHIGRFRARARVYPSADTVKLRISQSVRGGGISYGDWVAVPASAAFVDVDLGTVNVPPVIVGSHLVEFKVYAKATTGTPTVQLDYFKLFPAERYGRARGMVGQTSTIRAGRYLAIRHDAVISETSTGVWARHPNYVGAYLQIPIKGGRIAVAANRNDIEEVAHTPLGDSLRADLIVTPRVALLGA